ncbi:MAG: hypothetical protein G8345_10790 [Magnetococcales bacterium]|nr:hypothetical protein [Magnetococcales bacterium]NGZ27358.1 hypothetical protein [Magnetococcales bacterium]
MKQSLCVMLLAITLTGCASQTYARKDGDEQSKSCRSFFASLDDTVAKAGTGDSQEARLADFPYLRVNRFDLSLLAKTPENSPAWQAWLDLAQERDQKARGIEIANTPTLAPQQDTLQHKVNQCGQLLRQQDKPAKKRIQSQQVAPEYQQWKRILGVAPLTSLGIKMGVKRWHEETHALYAQPLHQLAIKGELIRYLPEKKGVTKAQQVAGILQQASRNPLNIPLPTPVEQEQLFATFAPVWEVDTASNDDRIGAPTWFPHRTAPRVDTSRPVVYHHLSHTWWQGRPLLQLSYQVWFPRRPLQSGMDLLGGEVDGILWRVTLQEDGTPLLYDTIHNCGCYHLFFPTARLQVKEEDEDREPPFAPQQAPPLQAGERMKIRVSSLAHMVDRILPVQSENTATNYTMMEDHTLRSLPTGEGFRSLYDENGIVPGTERGERYIFWTTGVPHPGEMRQWGHHATAFFGYRHFDDPDLLDRTFKPKN